MLSFTIWKPIEAEYLVSLAEESIDILGNANVDYAHLLGGIIIQRTAWLEDTDLYGITRNFAGSIGILVMLDGNIGYASTSVLEMSSLKRAIKKAIKFAKLARSLSKSKNETLPDISNLKSQIKYASYKAPRITRQPDDIGDDELLNLLIDSKKGVLSKSLQGFRITNIESEVGFISEYRFIVDIFGNKAERSCTFFNCSYEIVIKCNNDFYEGYENKTLVGGAELLSTYPPHTLADKAFEEIVEKIKAKRVKTGMHDIIVDPEFSGVIAHESFGHLSEADSIITGSSFLTGKKGKKLGSEIVSIIDTGDYVNGGIWLPFDDEGVLSNSVILVEKGIFLNYLHSLMTAHHFGEKATGNARTQSPLDPPLVRMRNTFFLGYEYEEEELLELIRNGILIKGSAGGESSDDGTFIFEAKRAYQIKNGEIIKPLKGVTIRSSIDDFLSNIIAASKDVHLFIGLCEKNDQTIFVGFGGPYMAVKHVYVSGD